MKKRLLTLPMLAMLTTILPGCSSKKEAACVLYTNDVHCALEQVIDKDTEAVTQMGYSSIASYKKDMKDKYGESNVYLIDNGDHLQGAYYGTLSLGEDVVKCMNAAGYNLAIPGNHEFDYGMDKFLGYAKDVAKYEYISSNFLHNGENVFKPYKVVKLGGRKIAFLGATTPDTYTSSTPKYFKDDSGKYVYTFSEGDKRDGKPLYEKIQSTVDEVRKKEKVDYVILMSHLGIDDVNSPYMSTEVIKNTTGIDVVLDGHSHSVIVRDKVKNKDGENVILSSTGTKLQYVGKLTIDEEGKLNTELVHQYKDQKDEEAKKTIEGIISAADKKTEEVVATTDFPLYTQNADNAEVRLVRKSETNLGDLVCDGFQAAETEVKTDFAFVNGGGVRYQVAKDEKISLKTAMSIHPFGNKFETYKTKGENILNFLEYSVKELPVREGGGVDLTKAKPGEFGGYMQCSKGIKYSVDTSIASPIVMDASGKLYSKVEGTRRIHSVQVAKEYNSDGTVKTWEALDPNKEYIFASTGYYVESQGDGYDMLKLGVNCEKVTQIQKYDWEVTFDYIKKLASENNGKIPAYYQAGNGGLQRVTYAPRA